MAEAHVDAEADEAVARGVGGDAAADELPGVADQLLDCVFGVGLAGRGDRSAEARFGPAAGPDSLSPHADRKRVRLIDDRREQGRPVDADNSVLRAHLERGDRERVGASG